MMPVYLLVLLAPVTAAGVLLARAVTDIRQRRQDRVFELRFPRELSAEAVAAFLRAVQSLLPNSPWHLIHQPSVILETHARPGRIDHWLRVASPYATQMLAHLRAAVPSIRIELVEPNRTQAWTNARELRLRRGQHRLRCDQPASVAAAMLASLQPLGNDEEATISWLLQPAVQVAPLKDLERIVGTTRSWLSRIGRHEREDRTPERDDHRAKFSDLTLAGVLRVGVRCEGHHRGRQLLRQVAAPLRIVASPYTGFRLRRLPNRVSTARLCSRRWPMLWPGMTLNVAELAALVAWPLESPALPGVILGGARTLPAHPDVPETGLVLGDSDYPDFGHPVALTEDQALRHLWLCGPTGSGKSTLMRNVIRQLIERGRGVCLVDPKGDLFADVLDDIGPEHQDRVVLLDPTDVEHPVGLNLLASSKHSPDVVTDQIVSVLHRLWEDSWGPRTDDILRAGLLTLMTVPDMTLAELPLLLGNATFRRAITSKLDDRVGLVPFWHWYQSLPEWRRSDVIAPLSNKIRSFILRPRIRNIIGQATSSFEMEDVLAEGKILLVNLASGSVGEDAAALLGSLLVARLWQAISARSMLPAPERTPFYVFIDEFQALLNLPTPVGELLAQARGFGVSLTLAHQHLHQLPLELRLGVLANTRSKIVWQSAAADAALVAKEFAPHLDAEDIQALDAFHAYAVVSIDAHVSPPDVDPDPGTLAPGRPRRSGTRNISPALRTQPEGCRSGHRRPTRPDASGRSDRPAQAHQVLTFNERRSSDDQVHFASLFRDPDRPPSLQHQVPPSDFANRAPRGSVARHRRPFDRSGSQHQVPAPSSRSLAAQLSGRSTARCYEPSTK